MFTIVKSGCVKKISGDKIYYTDKFVVKDKDRQVAIIIDNSYCYNNPASVPVHSSTVIKTTKGHQIYSGGYLDVDDLYMVLSDYFKQ